MSEATHILEARGVEFAYRPGEPVLRGVDLIAPADKLLCILGPNGSGKTTLLRCLLGQLRLSAGEIRLDGRDLHEYSARGLARMMAYVPQFPATAFSFTARELVLMGRFCHTGLLGLTGKKDVAVAEEAMRMTGTLEKPLITRAVSRVLHRVGIYGKRDRFPHELSGGEQQRAAIGRALIHQPPVLLADEPTGNLDAGTGREILEVLAQLHLSGTTILVATHDEDLARRYATRTLTLRNGRVVEDLFLRPHGTEVF
jgi:iron complex transport system ATP-binding protein